MMSVEPVTQTDDEFYSKAVQYWSEIPATVDGMLGGFGHISQNDIKGSRMFLKHLFGSKNPPGRSYALDCGAGIGRITKFLLCDLFEKVDLVEQNPEFLEKSKKYLGGHLEHKIGEFYPIGLQNFEPEEGKYDIIWNQWVLGHLKDGDLVKYLIRCQKGLKENGLIIVKENITSSNLEEKDDQDSSVTRSMFAFKVIFAEAGLQCYKQLKQTNFPKGIYSVFMFALKPCDKTLENIECDQQIKELSLTEVPGNLSNKSNSMEQTLNVSEPNITSLQNVSTTMELQSTDSTDQININVEEPKA